MKLSSLSRPPKGIVWAASVLCVLALFAYLFIHFSSATAAITAPPAQSAIATPPQAPIGAPGNPGSPPGKEQPVWAAVPPSFASKILHWTQTNYAYIAGGIDPANGQTVVGDIWMKVDANGLPSLFQGRYTLADGTFLQEIFQTPAGATVIFGPQYAKYSAPGSTGSACTTQQQASSADEMRNLLPPFADASKLASNGFAQKQASTLPQLPTTPPLAGVSPQQSFSAAAGAQQWTHQELKGNQLNNLSLITDQRGRVIFEQAQLTNAQGTITNETRIARGSLLVYDTRVVPASVFVTPDQVLGGCHA
jgi:hypothetical protein